MPSGDEGGAARGTGLLRIVVGEQRAFASNTVNARCAPSHHAIVVCTHIPGTNIVAKDDDDSGFCCCAATGTFNAIATTNNDNR